MCATQSGVSHWHTNPIHVWLEGWCSWMFASLTYCIVPASCHFPQPRIAEFWVVQELPNLEIGVYDQDETAIPLVLLVSFAHLGQHRHKRLDMQHVDEFDPFTNMYCGQVMHKSGLCVGCTKNHQENDGCSATQCALSTQKQTHLYSCRIEHDDIHTTV